MGNEHLRCSSKDDSTDLKDRELITIEKAESNPNGGFPPRIAVLTGEAKQRIRKGNLGGDLLDENEQPNEQTVTVTVSQFEEFRDELDTLSSRVDTLADYNRTDDDLDEDVEFLYQWIGLAERYMKATRYIFEEMNVDFEAAMEAIDDEG